MGYGDYNLNLPDGQNFEPDPARVRELQKVLSPEPYHFAPKAGNTAPWEALRDSEAARRLLEAAREAATPDEPLVMTNELYDYTVKAANRDRINPVFPALQTRLTTLPIAECLEPDGKYLDRIKADIRALAALDHWNHPNNDPHREQGIFIDLAGVHYAANIAATDWILGDRLSPEIRQMIRELLESRIFQPFSERIKTGKDVFWWIVCEHNWNSVCMAEILAAALAIKEDPAERAWYAAVAEKILTYSEKGFTPSGFYTEGVSYWVYGFSHYVLAAELVRGASGAAEDWMQKPEIELMSRYGARMEIQDSVFPSFADCDSSVKPDPWLVHWMNNRIDPNRAHRSTGNTIDPFSPKHYFFASIVHLLLFRQEDVRIAYAKEFPQDLREWFEDVQYLICRPGPDSETRMAATFKGGHNGVNHNHNDLGTFTALIGNQELIADPGREEYTFRTFSKDRYLGDLLNSFGHPVPVVAGQLQRPGKKDHRAGYGSEFYASVQETIFGDEADRVAIDLLHAYQVDTLKKLVRTFTYRRGTKETIEVSDEVAFFEPESFETALITFADWKRQADGAIIMTAGGKSLRVTISTEDGPLEFHHTVIQESSTPARLAWKFTSPIREARVTFHIEPFVEGN